MKIYLEYCRVPKDYNLLGNRELYKKKYCVFIYLIIVYCNFKCNMCIVKYTIV